MAEEVEMTPVEAIPIVDSEPPKASPLGAAPTPAPAPAAPAVAKAPVIKKPVVGGTQTTLRPGLKLPPKPGATVSALKPGLKLPPKPGATVTALKTGLKLPPKPGATVSALKPGLKLPPKPGSTVTALKPNATASTLKTGLKLPPKPVIHKPGDAVAPAALPKPVAPAAKVVPVDSQGVGKLPTVATEPVPRNETPAEPVKAEGEKPMEALKSVTQKLKGITQAIPQQAILRKTGIIAEGAVTEAQKEAAKHKTARISLSDAMGVAPTKDLHAPMKTIRIQRPINIPNPTSSSLKPQAKPEASTTDTVVKPVSEVSTAEPAVPTAEKPVEAPTTATQRKTLKIARPGATVRPSGKFGIRRPTVQAAPVAKPSAEGGETPAAGAPADAVPEIADIPSNVPPMPTASVPVDKTPGWLYALSSLVQAAAVVMIGALAWFLYQNTQIQYF